ncbi:MAG: nucleotide sugar dehydrogenase [Thaumarchaeota archaeon]|nr:nucleotide sugar dehydrogenase [Nitrososphaerota archaeon]
MGLGYVGLATAVCFARRGFVVEGIEVNKEKISSMENGSAPFEEKGVASMLRASLKSRRLRLSSDYEAVSRTEVTFITVGTPSGPDGAIDLKYVESAARSVASKLRDKDSYHVVVVKSTVIPGTTEREIIPILEAESGKKEGDGFGVAVNPEFLREGSAVKDTLKPEALVLGVKDSRASKKLLDIYKKFYRKMPETILTTPSTAEVVKYSINISRAVQVSLVYSLADICGLVPGGEFGEVARGLAIIARMDRRYLGPGLGYGGSCLPKDTRALAALADSLSTPSALFRAALAVNDVQPREALALAKGALGKLEGRQTAVLGLAFKAGTDDVRESAALRLVNLLIAEGAKVRAYDPVATENARRLLGDGVAFASSMAECIRGAECCFIATEWNEFRALTPAMIKKLMGGEATLVDCKRLLDPSRFEGKGVRYLRVGTAPARPQ